MTTTRRRFVVGGLASAGLSTVMPWAGLLRSLATVQAAEIAGSAIPKFVTPLVIPPAMPRKGVSRSGVDLYEIALRQFLQQILPVGFPRTTVWGYGSPSDRATFHAPSFTLETRHDRPARVRWINQLVDRDGRFRPHLLAVDPTLHWANPPGGREGRDGSGHFEDVPGPYQGPVPMVVHVHGAETTQESDGYAEAWYLPDASNIPSGHARVGSYFNRFRKSSPLGGRWSRGEAVFQYPNDQRATTLWYHDHTLGMTRLNVYAGPAGFYIVRGGPSGEIEGVLPGPAPARGGRCGPELLRDPARDPGSVVQR